MTLRSSSFSLVVLWMACFGLVLTGCDSNGGGSDAPEPTTFDVTIKNVSSPAPILKSGAFTPADVINDNNNVPPLEPGEAFQFSFTAGPNEIPGSGMQLSFASMFVQSNDAYYAFEAGGLSLFDDDGTPIGMDSPADVTGSVRLYDAGTEVDQEPGTGNNQAPRQGSLDQGSAENGNVTRIKNTDSDDRLEDSGFEYPAIADGVKMTVSSQKDSASGSYTFTVTLENVGGGQQVNGAPLVLSPGSYAVHWDQKPNGDDLTYPGHAPGSSASAGIERIAEDGKPAGADGVDGNHVKKLAGLTGVTVPLSPGAYAVHPVGSMYQLDQSANTGIERIAEDGKPGEMVSMLKDDDNFKTAAAFNTPDGANSAGPIPPGKSYSFSVEAVPGDRLSFATLYIQSNDFFYSFQPGGIALFDGNDKPISGDVTGQVMLYDAGTEGDEEPGAGLNQAIRQSALDTGPGGEESVKRIKNTDDDSFLDDDGFNYVPTLNSSGKPTLIKVTVTPQ